MRQLENILRHIILLNDGPVITLEMLPGNLKRFTEDNPILAANQNAHDVYMTPDADSNVIKPLWLTEKQTIQQALTATGHDVPRAAAILEISASTIYRKLLAWSTENQLAAH